MGRGGEEPHPLVGEGAGPVLGVRQGGAEGRRGARHLRGGLVGAAEERGERRLLVPARPLDAAEGERADVAGAEGARHGGAEGDEPAFRVLGVGVRAGGGDAEGGAAVAAEREEAEDGAGLGPVGVDDDGGAGEAGAGGEEAAGGGLVADEELGLGGGGGAGGEGAEVAGEAVGGEPLEDAEPVVLPGERGEVEGAELPRGPAAQPDDDPVREEVLPGPGEVAQVGPELGISQGGCPAPADEAAPGPLGEGQAQKNGDEEGVGERVEGARAARCALALRQVRSNTNGSGRGRDTHLERQRHAGMLRLGSFEGVEPRAAGTEVHAPQRVARWVKSSARASDSILAGGYQAHDRFPSGPDARRARRWAPGTCPFPSEKKNALLRPRLDPH